MGALMLLGCLLIAYSVPTAVFFMMLFRKAQLVIVMFASAFFWLLALTVSSLIWSAIPPLQNSTDAWAIVPVGVFVQEVARGLFIRLYFRCERSFAVVSINAIVFPLIDLYSSIAAGVGFGAMQSFIFYSMIVGQSLGPGALFHENCSQFSSFFSSAWTALFFNICHICWMVVSFDAYRDMNPLKIGLVVALHGLAGGMTVLNNLSDGCTLSLPLLAVVTLLSIVLTIYITHRPDYRSSKAKRVHVA